MGCDSVPSLDEQRNFWNTWNTAFRESGRPDQMSLQCADAVVDLVRSLNLKNADIIEVGCGTGWFTERLVSFGAITGIDLAGDVIARARERMPSILFIAGDVLVTDLPGQYDVAITNFTLSHVYDQRAFIARLAGLLKPSGHLILATQNRFVLERDNSISPIEPGQIRKWLTIREIKHLLKPHFYILKIRTIVPRGHLGILRLINSRKLNPILASLIGQGRVTSLKEYVGLGQTILVLAQRKVR